MDAYPPDYINHNLPLVLLSGLEADAKDESRSAVQVDYPLLAEKGPKVFSDFPPLSGAVAEELRRVLLEEDGSQMPWRAGLASSGNSSSPHIAYCIKSCGRVSYPHPVQLRHETRRLACAICRGC
jgi:hypothetical protein